MIGYHNYASEFLSDRTMYFILAVWQMSGILRNLQIYFLDNFKNSGRLF